MKLPNRPFRYIAIISFLSLIALLALGAWGIMAEKTSKPIQDIFSGIAEILKGINSKSIYDTRFIFVLVFILAFLGIVSSIATFAEEIFAKRKTTKYLQGSRKQALFEGEKAGLSKVIQVLDSDPSVLRNIVSWLHDYGKGRQDIQSAADIFKQLLSRFLTLQIKQIGTIGEHVTFDPAYHRTLRAGLRKGDSVVIIESGWAIGDNGVRKPLIDKVGQ